MTQANGTIALTEELMRGTAFHVKLDTLMGENMGDSRNDFTAEVIMEILGQELGKILEAGGFSVREDPAEGVMLTKIMFFLENAGETIIQLSGLHATTDTDGSWATLVNQKGIGVRLLASARFLAKEVLPMLPQGSIGIAASELPPILPSFWMAVAGALNPSAMVFRRFLLTSKSEAVDDAQTCEWGNMKEYEYSKSVTAVRKLDFERSQARRKPTQTGTARDRRRPGGLRQKLGM